MQITVYKNFKKKENSTKRPSGGTNVTVHLKNDTSFLTPSFLMESPDLTINYCKWNNRYYFVTDIVLISNQLYEIMCQVDVLATYKDEIGASTQYVLRSAADSDGSIIDTLYPTKVGTKYPTNGGTTVISPFQNGYIAGSYIVGIVNNDSSGNSEGAVMYYMMSKTQFRSLLHAMLSYDSETGGVYGVIEDVGENLWKSIFNPFQYIVSCMYIPLELTYGSSVPVLFGWYGAGISAHTLPSTIHVANTITLTVPKHPQAADRGVYLNCEPYTRYALDFKPFGYIPLDSSILADCDSINLVIKVDLVTGEGVLSIGKTGESDSFIDVRAQIGIPIQLAQINNNPLNAITSGVSSAASMGMSLATGNIAGAITSFENGISSAVSAMVPQMQTNGGNGSFVNCAYFCRLKAKFLEVVDENNEHRGRPLCKDKVISTVPGYNVVLDAELDIAGTASEKSAVKSFMESGFFYE